MRDETRDRLRAAYDGQAAARDARQPAPWKRGLRASFLDCLGRERCIRLLEIGSGAGHDGSFFAGEGLDIVCIDLSPEMVRRCREKGLDAHLMDACDLRFPDGSFDAAYSLNALLHLPHGELSRALREICRVLRPGGLFFLGCTAGTTTRGFGRRTIVSRGVSLPSTPTRDSSKRRLPSSTSSRSSGSPSTMPIREFTSNRLSLGPRADG